MTTAPDKDPAMTLGVPMYWFRINIVVFGMGLIAFQGLLPKLILFVVVNIPLHVFGYVMTKRDHHWMSERLDMGWAIAVIGGLALVFSAVVIVDSVRGAL